MIKKILLYFIGTIALLFITFFIYYNYAVDINPPSIENAETFDFKREKLGDNFYVIGNNWIKKNKQGLWEMYLEGNAFDRGVINGKLAKELVVKQEDEFIGQIKKMIPNENYLKFLKYLIAWFNRDINDYVPIEYQKEIYGVSRSASEKYSFIGDNYGRILNYHAAHDIGHALQEKNFVPGCSSFSSWSTRSKDSSLIIGRNFDFYVGDGFAEDKIICFIKPDMGYKIMFVTWGGMIGVVSGMNEKGLTITLNASKSDIPSKSAMPISILAREILQYAKNIDEAYAIAQKRETFVSESIMIGSAEDGITAIIEKSPTKCDLYKSGKKEIVCSNHFQGKAFQHESDIVEQASEYRYKRMDQLLSKYDGLSVKDYATILRDQKGLNDKNIGMGNEKALNQLIAHHSIIFQPEKKLVWVSANPFQLGEYVCYDLNKIFKDYQGLKINKDITELNLNIPADSFLFSVEYKKFVTYKEIRDQIKNDVSKGIFSKEREDKIADMIACNPELYYAYWMAGDFYKGKKEYRKASGYYTLALSKEVPRANEIEYLNNAINECINEY